MPKNISKNKRGKRISQSMSEMIKVMTPLDANHYGYVHGGAIMRYIDEAAFISGMRHTRCNIVTAAIDHLSFENPVRLGDLLILKSAVNYVGSTSMEIGVRIEAEDPVTGDNKFIGRAYVTMVALDDLGKPTTIIPLILDTSRERQRFEMAKQRRAFRLKQRPKK